MNQEKIFQAAIKYEDVIYTIPKPGRHSSIMLMGDDNRLIKGEQGFLTTKGRFVDRTEAYDMARNAHQLLPGLDHLPGKLYTEYLW